MHPADMIAHEVVTARSTSQPLKVLDDYLEVQELTHERIRGALDDYEQILRPFKREQLRQRLARRIERKKR